MNRKPSSEPRQGHYEKVNPDDYRFVTAKLKEMFCILYDIELRLTDRRIKK